MRRKTRNKMICLRLNEFEESELQKISEETGQSISSFVRIAILEKKQRIELSKKIKKEDKK